MAVYVMTGQAINVKEKVTPRNSHPLLQPWTHQAPEVAFRVLGISPLSLDTETEEGEDLPH